MCTLQNDDSLSSELLETVRSVPPQQVDALHGHSTIIRKRRRRLPVAHLIDEIIGLIHDDAEALGCVDEVLHVRDILDRTRRDLNDL